MGLIKFSPLHDSRSTLGLKNDQQVVSKNPDKCSKRGESSLLLASNLQNNTSHSIEHSQDVHQMLQECNVLEEKIADTNLMIQKTRINAVKAKKEGFMGEYIDLKEFESSLNKWNMEFEGRRRNLQNAISRANTSIQLIPPYPIPSTIGRGDTLVYFNRPTQGLAIQNCISKTKQFHNRVPISILDN